MLSLRDFFREDKIGFFEDTEKSRCLSRMVELAASDNRVENRDELYNAILEREEIYSTGIGFGIALPHARTPTVKRITLSLGVFRNGIEYGSMDDKPVYVIVLIAVPEYDQDLYIRVLSRVLAFLKKEREALRKASSAAAIVDIAARY